MDDLEKVERLVAKAGISYAEAKDILEQTDGDLLDAIILLEKQGRLASPQEEGTPDREAAEENKGESEKGSGKNADPIRGFLRWIKSLVIRGSRNNLVIRRGDGVLGAVPVTVIVAAVIFAFWVTVPLLIVGLFCGCSYSFSGPDLERENINKAWDKASQMAETIKEDIKKEMNRDNDK